MILIGQFLDSTRHEAFMKENSGPLNYTVGILWFNQPPTGTTLFHRVQMTHPYHSYKSYPTGYVTPTACKEIDAYAKLYVIGRQIRTDTSK